MSGNQPTLIVTGGPLDGQVLRLARRGQTVLGSGADTAAPLALANVAAHHATLEWDGQELHLAALETPTGTYVNGERISATHVLADGDRLCLGPPGSKQSVKLVVRLSADEGEPEEEAAGAAEEALPGFEAPDLDGTLDLSSPSAPEAPSLLLIDPDAAEPREPAVAETALPGWSDTTVGVQEFDGLPQKAQSYLKRMEELCEVPIDVVSTGPDRVETIVRRHPYEA